MSRIRILVDEDVHEALAAILRERGFDAVSTRESNRLGESDTSQLLYASQEGRVLLTFNVGHFARLHGEWLTHSRPHAGIIVSSQRPIGDVLRRVLTLASSLSAEEMQDRLEFL